MKVERNLCFPTVGHNRLVVCSLEKVRGGVFPLALESKNPGAESQAIWIFEICLPDEEDPKIKRNVLYFSEGCDSFLNIYTMINGIFNKGGLVYL